MRPGVSGKQQQCTGTDNAPIPIGCSTLDIAHLVGEAEIPTFHKLLACATLDPVPATTGSLELAMDLFTQLFGNFIAFVYHCFDRIVIHGYLTGLSRPEHVVHFFRQVIGTPVITKEILSERTNQYQNWVEAFARNHRIPIEWAEKGVRKEDFVRRWQRRMVRNKAYGVYFIFKSLEVGPTFRITVPKYPAQDPNYRIVALQRSRFTHYYFYIRDEMLGPIVMYVGSCFPFKTTYYLNGHSFIEQQLNRAEVGFRKDDNAFLAVSDVAALQAIADELSPQIIRERLDYWTFLLGPKFSARERRQVRLSRIYAISQIEYCVSFVLKRDFSIHKLFERSCELGLWRLTRTRSPRCSACASSATTGGSSPPSSIRSSMAIMSSAPISAMRFSGSTRSSRCICATSCAPTTSTTSVSKRAWIISTTSATSFTASSAASPVSRRTGSTSTPTFRCCRKSPCRSRSARCATPVSKSTTRASSACSRFCCTPAPVGGWTRE